MSEDRINNTDKPYDKMSLEKVEWRVKFYMENPSAVDYGQDIDVYSQLADTMRRLESIVGQLEPVADVDWHGKWRIQSAIALAKGEQNKESENDHR